MTAIIPADSHPAPGNGSTPGPLAGIDPITAADVLAIIGEIRRTLARVEGYLDGVAASSPALRAGRALGRPRGRRHARHGAR